MKKLVASSTSHSSASSSSEEEEEEEMLRHCGQRYAAEDLSAAAFGDVRGEALDPPQATSVASAAAPPVATGETPSAPVAEMDPAAVAKAAPSTVVEVGSALPPAAIFVDDSPPDLTTRAGGRASSAEAT